VPDADDKGKVARARCLDTSRRVLENRSSRWKYTEMARGI
jgi:hypothetical protein